MHFLYLNNESALVSNYIVLINKSIIIYLRASAMDLQADSKIEGDFVVFFAHFKKIFRGKFAEHLLIIV